MLFAVLVCFWNWRGFCRLRCAECDQEIFELNPIWFLDVGAFNFLSNLGEVVFLFGSLVPLLF